MTQRIAGSVASRRDPPYPRVVDLETMGRRGLPWLLAATLLSSLGGCSTGSEQAPLVELGADGTPEEGIDNSCEPGTERECHQMLAEHNGVLSCYDGTQICGKDGKWGACGEGAAVSLIMPSGGAAAKRLSAITNHQECESNPCDPECRVFPDLPDAATSDNLIVTTSPFDWQTGSLSQSPGGLVKKGLKEPCMTGSDCQYNSYCINPVTEECTHSKCSAGSALIAECDPCVEMVCETNPECCTGYTGGCSHDLGAVGDPLAASCDECVGTICSTPGFEYCCDATGGTWDSACIAEVENTCGGTVSCCEGEVEFEGNCYYVEDDTATWSNARSSCQARGAGWDLVSIGSSDENEFVYDLNGSTRNWIGLTSANGLSSGNNWVWSNGDPSGAWNSSSRTGHPFNAFESGEPDSGDKCTRMEQNGDGSWGGRSCSSSYESVCEGPPSCGGGLPPAEPPAACEHDPCTVGVALKSNCDACVQAVCESDPSCCDQDEAWTEACIALIATECTSTCECGSSEQSYGSHCYTVHTAGTPWATALSTCRNKGPHWDLVSISNSNENDFVRGLNGSNDTWIGFTEYSTYGGSNNRWVWTSGEPSGNWRESGQFTGLTYVNWYSGEPDGSGECARMRANSSGQWADFSCSTSYDYICEADHGSTLSALEPVLGGSPSDGSGGISYGSGGGSVDIGEWTEECVDRVASVCDAQCGEPEERGTGVCLPWYPGQTDPDCAGVDLAVGVPCDDNIPVCNHGNATAPAGLRLVHFPANSNQYPSCDPDQTHPQMYECFTDREIPPGECIDVTTCPQMVGNREIMVNPDGASHVDECSCLDNWSLYSGGECGPPVCSGGTNVATLQRRPVDIIVSVDNSKSMQGEIEAIQQRLNEDFAQILELSGIDYRVILVARYGNVHIENFNGGSVATSAYSICIGSPLSGITCPTSSSSSTPPVQHNSPRFFHHSTDIGSHDMWCQLLGSFDSPDPYSTARTGFTSIAPDGWEPYLRDDAFKVFVGITDDSPDTNASGTSGNCASTTGFTNNAAGATAFDQALRAKAPEQFGSYDASDPDANRNYAWYSIVGMAGNHVNNPTPLAPSAAVETKCCRGDGTSTSSCPGNFGGDADGAGNGVGYQQLSKMTGALRYPSCYNDNFDEVFNAIATEVVEGAQVSCNFELQNSGSFEINTAQVFFQEDPNAQPVLLERAVDSSECSAEGWYLPDPSTPEVVALCPEACAAAQSNPDSRLSVEVGCAGSGYDSYSFSETFVAECRYDQIPQWGFLSVVATTPGDSSVGLRVRSADSEAELMSAEFLPLAVLDTQSGNTDCSSPAVDGCPLDLYTALDGAPLAHHSSIEFEVTVTPTSDASALPVIDEWSVTFTCVDAE